MKDSGAEKKMKDKVKPVAVKAEPSKKAQVIDNLINKAKTEPKNYKNLQTIIKIVK